MSYCSLCYNNQESADAGTIYSSGSSTTLIRDSVFVGNMGGALFYKASGSGTYVVIDNFIEENQVSFFSVVMLSTVSFISIPMSINCDFATNADNISICKKMTNQFINNIFHNIKIPVMLLQS